MNHIILTGASKGIGKALLNHLKKDKNNQFYLIARHFQKSTETPEKTPRENLHSFDLSNTLNIPTLMQGIFTQIKKAQSPSDAYFLINNAGMLSPIAFSGNITAEEIQKHMQVNLIAPMILTSCFIQELQDLQAEKRIINLSSGASLNPYAGWSCYTSAKAGLDMFTKTVALEQSQKKHPIKLIAFAPGVVQTQMQEQILQTKKANFPLLDKFKSIKENKQYMPKEKVAKAIESLLFKDVKNGERLDIRFH